MRAGFEKLHRFLTTPASLLEDPTFQALRRRIADARAAHRSTRPHQAALEEYVRACLRGSSTLNEQRTSQPGGSQ